jgi:hypothetical protein
MKARAALACAMVLVSSLAAYAWLEPRPLGTPLARARVQAPSAVLAAAPLKASPAVRPRAAEAEHTREQPHAITPARAAIAAQSSLFLEIERALSARDVVLVKRLLSAHERQFPDLDGGAETRKGYAAIASCIGSPGGESRANGERFIADHRASPLRRKVRHACLGARTPVILPPA